MVPWGAEMHPPRLLQADRDRLVQTCEAFRYCSWSSPPYPKWNSDRRTNNQVLSVTYITFAAKLSQALWHRGHQLATKAACAIRPVSTRCQMTGKPQL